MLRPIFAVLPLDIRSLGYRARAAAWGSADAALSGVQRFSVATACPRVARGCGVCGSADASLSGVQRFSPATARLAPLSRACCNLRASCVSNWDAVSGVYQRFLAAISCEIRLVASLGIVSGPSRRCAKESGFFDPLRPGQILKNRYKK